MGQETDNDYRIVPTAHAALYRASAAALARILESTEARVSAEEYERADTAAIEAEHDFNRAANRANLAVLAIAILGAGVMVLALFDAPAFTLLPLGIAEM